MVSLVSVHGSGFVFDIYGLIHFPLVSVLFLDQDFVIFQIH